VIFADAGGHWRWRLVAANDRTIATSGESFDSESNATRAAREVKATAADAVVLAKR
jgi:uncharacterized protein YegP (UPF0339 family)